MKKRVRRKKHDDGAMRSHYDFSKGKRNKYAERYAKGTNIVVLDPDVAEFFKDSQTANAYLRATMRMLLEDNPIISRIRAIRHKISAKFGHDVSRYCEHLMERQKKNPMLIVKWPDPVGRDVCFRDKVLSEIVEDSKMERATEILKPPTPKKTRAKKKPAKKRH